MRAAALVSICLSTVAYAEVDDAIDMTRKSIQIEPEALQVALPTFGKVEGLHMVYLADDVRDQSTAGVSGNLTHVEALEQLLRGTHLTYRFLEAHTVMILPLSLAPEAAIDPSSAPESGDKRGEGTDGPVGPGTRMAQVTVTAAKPSDTQQVEYFRLLAALSRSNYKRKASTLPFVDVGTVQFPGGEGPEHRLPLGEHIQPAGVDGLVLWRVINLTSTKAQSELQVHNGNSFPVFVEVDFDGTASGRGAYAGLAPGETAVWAWAPRSCRVGPPGPAWYSSMSLVDWGDCNTYVVEPGTAHVRVLEDWGPG